MDRQCSRSIRFRFCIIIIVSAHSRKQVVVTVERLRQQIKRAARSSRCVVGALNCLAAVLRAPKDCSVVKHCDQSYIPASRHRRVSKRVQFHVRAQACRLRDNAGKGQPAAVFRLSEMFFFHMDHSDMNSYIVMFFIRTAAVRLATTSPTAASGTGNSIEGRSKAVEGMTHGMRSPGESQHQATCRNSVVQVSAANVMRLWKYSARPPSTESPSSGTSSRGFMLSVESTARSDRI